MKIAVGLSGGVDSSVAAYLLIKEGYEVFGLTMKNSPDIITVNNGKSACIGEDNKETEEDVRKIAEKLKISYHILDLTEDFETKVMTYFKDEYKKGRTPNPCVVCNCRIKFNALLDRALADGIEFDLFGTGHYARVEYNEERKRFILKKAIYLEKDQTYFLAFLNQFQLSRLIFPLGTYTKSEVRKIAESIGLHTHDKIESQDFYSGDYKNLLDVKPIAGPIKHVDGRILGTHMGYFNYTIGQRKGLGVSYNLPIFVVSLDPESNTVFVGEEKYLLNDKLYINKFNWVSIENPGKQFKASVKIRYRHEAESATIIPISDELLEVIFDNPQKAITPGQVGAIYINDELVGGGFIELESSL